MTTVDMMLVAASFANVWRRINKFLAGQFLPFADDAVDVARWAWRARMRRKARKPGVHRASTNSFTVWTYFDRMSDEELGRSTFSLARVGGKYRDRRGWRHAPTTWKQIPIWESERLRQEKEVDWDRTVRGLIEDIQYMLQNPPAPETFHGCKDCLCGLVPA